MAEVGCWERGRAPPRLWLRQWLRRRRAHAGAVGL